MVAKALMTFRKMSSTRSGHSKDGGDKTATTLNMDSDVGPLLLAAL